MNQSCQQLIQTLDQLISVYRHLLDLVRKEKEALTSAQMDQLGELNKSKEKMVVKIKELELSWMDQADKLAKALNISDSKPSLKDLAMAVGGKQGEKLQSQRQVLNMLVTRLAELNKKNEALVQSALSHINGAMQAITDFLKPNKTYKSQGKIRGDSDGASGRLIAKEV